MPPKTIQRCRGGFLFGHVFNGVVLHTPSYSGDPVVNSWMVVGGHPRGQTWTETKTEKQNEGDETQNAQVGVLKPGQRPGQYSDKNGRKPVTKKRRTSMLIWYVL